MELHAYQQLILPESGGMEKPGRRQRRGEAVSRKDAEIINEEMRKVHFPCVTASPDGLAPDGILFPQDAALLPFCRHD